MNLPPDRDSRGGGGGHSLLHGIPVSPGIAVGEVFVLGAEEFEIDNRPIEASETDTEQKRFFDALDRTRHEIEKIRTRYRSVIGEELVRVFDAQILILQDPTLLDGTTHRIQKELQSATAAFQAIISEAIVNLSRVENDYLRDRVEDLKDVRRRVLRHLSGRGRKSLSHLKKNVILVAEDLTPSETVQIPRSKVKGFVTRQGGATSHTAIMARSLQIPAVVGVEGLLDHVHHRDIVVIDGSEGQILVNPAPDVLKKARKQQRRYKELSKERKRLHDLPSRTRDGLDIKLLANVEFPEEIPLALENRAAGIGLFRTEFLFFRESDLSDEDAQTSLYRKILKRVSPEVVVFRTLDVGGDKVLDPMSDVLEPNPMLGWRGIRISLELRPLFRKQLRALLRASVDGNLRILFPMITTIEEIRASKRILAEVREELELGGHHVPKNYEVGVMIETPAAVSVADHIAREVDFMSIGTNDLIQYSLAVDRDNMKIAHLFDPFHPAVVRMVHSVLEVGRESDTPVSICGEMAGEPLAALLLIGLGARELSVHPYLIPELKRLITRMSSVDAHRLAEQVLELPTGHDIHETMEEYLHMLESEE